MKASELIDDIELVEKLAAVEHERWSAWQKHLHGRCKWTPDGIGEIGATDAERWRHLINTPYADLPEHSKEADRREARKTLNAIVEHYFELALRGAEEDYFEIAPKQEERLDLELEKEKEDEEPENE